MTFLVLFIVLFIMLAIGVPVGFAIGGATMFSMYFCSNLNMVVNAHIAFLESIPLQLWQFLSLC